MAWAPAAWAVAEGTLRRAVFDSQALAETFKSRTEFADAASRRTRWAVSGARMDS